MRNFFLTISLYLFLINNCFSQQQSFDYLYIDALNYIKLNTEVRKNVLNNFCGNYYRKIVFKRKYFKKNIFSFRIHNNLVDSSFFHILKSKYYEDTILSYTLNNINNSNNITSMLDIKDSSLICFNDTLSPFLVVFSKIYNNYLCASIFLNNYYNSIDFYYSSRVEVLFFLNEDKKIIKTLFSSIIIE